ncbi:hypothetical protein [Streptomyces sp. 4N124]|uniref:hypothetical protein n=1 Tax=Streptomyces sp. 4N124 TaxID=3457420 RepID=UPI003FD606B5
MRDPEFVACAVVEALGEGEAVEPAAVRQGRGASDMRKPAASPARKGGETAG